MKLLSIVGARPQFVKLAPLCDAIRRTPGWKHVIVHSGQHYDYAMSKSFFERLNIPKPDHNLSVGSGSHATQTAACLEKLEAVLTSERPDWVMVYGDTNTTLAGALTARKLNMRIAHLEAGLRSFNKQMPEETNRIVADHCSDLLLCPTDTALRQLKQESFSLQKRTKRPWATNVGDIMHDVLLAGIKNAGSADALMRKFKVTKKRYYLATVHRQENTDDPTRLKKILEGLMQVRLLAPVIFPIHPRTQKTIHQLGLIDTLRDLYVCPPVDYFEMLLLQQQATAILTDSGGVQKEAYLLKTPCITLRDETEWPETVTSGWNTLVGANASRILAVVRSLKRPTKHPNYFGDGHTADRVLRLLRTA